MVILHGISSSTEGILAPVAVRHEYWHAVLTRTVAALALCIAAGFGALIASRLGPTGSPPAVVAPLAPLQAWFGPLGGSSVPNDAWITARTVTLRVAVESNSSTTPLRAEAELRPAGWPFSGVPTAASPVARVPAHHQAQLQIVVPNLADGVLYHWQVRTWNSSGQVSAWIGGATFGVSALGPAAPELADTNVRVGGWSNTTLPVFRWVDGGSLAPIAYHEYRVLAMSDAGGWAKQPWQRVDGQVLALPNLPQGQWQVELRAVDRAGNTSPAAEWLFSLQRQPPPAPVPLVEVPRDGSVSNAAIPRATLAVTPGGAPIAQLEYAAAVGSGAPAPWVAFQAPGLALPELSDATWTIYVRSVDAAGNASAPVAWRFTLDRQVPYLTTPSMSADAFTGPVQVETVHIGLGKPADVQFAVFADGAKQPIATRSLGMVDPGPVSGVAWDGHISAKHLAPAGSYHFVIEARDPAGNVTLTQTPSFVLQDKRILVSIGKEAMWAYQGDKLIAYTLVTNGGPDTPTIPGIYHVEAKEQHFTMRSPWPKSSPLYYAPSKVNYALLYNADGGYFLHDAPWRWNYGPGSNSVAGTPGGNYTGTHGCTNVPFATMLELYNWADIGTLVQIVQ